MPFSIFKRKKEPKLQPAPVTAPPSQPQPTEDQQKEANKLTFHAQLAHGSPTAKLESFTNLKQLYNSIAVAFNVQVEEILFCTLNTHKCDMERLIGGQIGLEDFIFAHVKGNGFVCSNKTFLYSSLYQQFTVFK